MFVGGMYAAAFFESDPRKVVEAGLACIPPRVPTPSSSAICSTGPQNPDGLAQGLEQIEDKWDKDDPCPDGALGSFNIDAKLNGSYIAFGLIYGKGDFDKTMEIATRCGQDSDCNPSSAAGVLGTIIGFSNIPEQYRTELAKLADTKFQFTDYSFNDIVASPNSAPTWSFIRLAAKSAIRKW